MSVIITNMPFKNHIFNVRQIALKAKEAGSKKSNIYEHLNFTLNNDALLGSPHFIDEIKAVIAKDCQRIMTYLDKHKEKLEKLEKERRKV